MINNIVLNGEVSLDNEIKELHMLMLKTASLVEESIEQTIVALRKQDSILAKNVFNNDDVVDNLEIIIGQKCMCLLSKQHLDQKQLQTVVAALKIITDMERIADHAADIAEVTILMSHEKYIRPLIDISRMAELAKEMVNKSIDAYINNNTKLAKEVCLSDDAVDELYYKLIVEFTNSMKNDPSTVEQSINFLMIAKYLERMGDHATNISEWAVFSVTGEYKHLTKPDGKKEIKDPFSKLKNTF